MKIVSVWYTGTWSTSLEVPDDWELTIENSNKLIEANQNDFDFQDGGAEWSPTFVAIDGGPELGLE